uniref:Putative LAGLIDADG homing endonuclease n=1 Tax=Hazenia capsulata TaxID=2202518 RepID=A0A1W6EHL0_9CHLO|nr:putative LAGLIDADG homing endonuclease [Hazenia capsulata]ARK14904.1 putative LAGLIDADG homing endonuclease [Hazenia capsulata]
MCCKKNQPLNLNSSETTREAPFLKKQNFCFSFYFENYQPEHLKTKDIKFLEWFIGFSEGDGCFLITGSKTNCSFIINQKDISLLYKIRTRLGFGKVTTYVQEGQMYGRYSVHSQKDCLRLAYLFNGNLILNKTNKRFIKWLKVLSVLPLKTIGSVSFNNGWLSGFIEAEGSFHARIRLRKTFKTGRQLIYKFSLNQAGEFALLSEILQLLNSKSKVYPITNNNKTKQLYYGISVQSFESNNILLNYLDLYPFLGKKTIAINLYRRINVYIKKKKHLTNDGLNEMLKFCNQLKKHNLKEIQK